MTEDITGKPPMSFWLIGGIALIWNLFGMYIYVNQVTATPAGLAAGGYTLEQIDFMMAIPQWATSAFAIAVTTGVVACLFLLLRKALATALFVISLAAVLVQNFYTFALNDALTIFGPAPAVIQSVVIIVAAALIWYARHARNKGWAG